MKWPRASSVVPIIEYTHRLRYLENVFTGEQKPLENLKGQDHWDEMIERFCHTSDPGDPTLRFRDAYAL
jgi:hypothetical protein